MLRREKEKGFTLVELIIVIAILAIIVAIAVPQYTGLLADAKTKTIESDKAMITKAVELCLEFDADAADLVSSYGTNKVIEDKSPLIPKYLKNLPKDPDENTYSLMISKNPNGTYNISVTTPGE